MITQSQLNEIVARIIQAAKPERIILFGSYAKGAATAESDLDLLVIVKESPLPHHHRARLIRKQLWGITDILKDIKVYTEAEVAEWANVDQAFITGAVRSGKSLYENQN